MYIVRKLLPVYGMVSMPNTLIFNNEQEFLDSLHMSKLLRYGIEIVNTETCVALEIDTRRCTFTYFDSEEVNRALAYILSKPTSMVNELQVLKNYFSKSESVVVTFVDMTTRELVTYTMSGKRLL